MATYRYKAADAAGRTVAGHVTAESAAEARDRVRALGLMPESVERGAEAGLSRLGRLPAGRARAALSVALFARELSALLLSGAPLVEALDVLARQCEHKGLALALAQAGEAVSAGKPFAQALAQSPQFFDEACVGMAAFGEKSGDLGGALARLADFLERKRLARARLASALIYPCLLAVMVVALLVFIAAYVVPMIAPLLLQRNRPLPFLTWALFSMGGAAKSFWWAPLALIVTVWTGAAWMKRSPRRRAWMDRLALRLPLLGRLSLKSHVSRFAMALSALLRTGAPAVEALEIVERMTTNAALAQEIGRIRGDVIEGKDLSARMKTSGVLPPMAGYMAAVGERSGALAETLERLASAYDLEVEIATRRLMAALEPALTLAMAAVVGFIALALMTTILELSHI